MGIASCDQQATRRKFPAHSVAPAESAAAFRGAWLASDNSLAATCRKRPPSHHLKVQRQEFQAFSPRKIHIPKTTSPAGRTQFRRRMRYIRAITGKLIAPSI